MSSAALVPSAACAAASAGDAPPARADSTAVARSGVPPMLTKATLPSCAAQPTMAQSSPRWANFWNDQPAVGRRGLGHRDRGEQLVGLQRGLEQALEEVPDPDLPLAARAARD